MGVDDETESAKDRRKRLDALHEKHAPAVLQVMLDLKGLYVKLGQVLSVTALPMPQVYRQHFRTCCRLSDLTKVSNSARSRMQSTFQTEA